MLRWATADLHCPFSMQNESFTGIGRWCLLKLQHMGLPHILLVGFSLDRMLLGPMITVLWDSRSHPHRFLFGIWRKPK